MLKKDKAEQRDKATGRLLAPSVLSILLCVVCLLGSTLAWFSSNAATPLAPLKSATYTVGVTVTGEGGDVAAAADDSYLLAPGVYQVTLSAEGSASSGYAILRLGEEADFEELHTKPISVSSSLTVSIMAEVEVKLRILPSWGSSSREEALWLTEEKGCMYPAP